jgi:dienelactone hydrolase
VKTQKLEYTNGQTKFIGHLALDEKAGGRRPGVVVFPEAFGLDDYARQCAERLTQLGYVALAADLNGGGVVNDDMAKVGPAIQALYSDRAEWRARAPPWMRCSHSPRWTGSGSLRLVSASAARLRWN